MHIPKLPQTLHLLTLNLTPETTRLVAFGRRADWSATEDGERPDGERKRGGFRMGVLDRLEGTRETIRNDACRTHEDASDGFVVVW